MNREFKTAFYTALILLLTVILLYLLYTVRGIFPPIIYSAIIAYLLLPVTNFFAKKIRRGFASFLSLLIFFLILVGISYFLFPVLIHEFMQLTVKIPDIYKNIVYFLSKVKNYFAPAGTEVLENLLQSFFDNLQRYLTTAAQQLLEKTINKISIIPSILFSFLLAFFLMRDSKIVYALTLRRFNGEKREIIKDFLERTNKDLRAYFSILVLIAMSTGIVMGLTSSIIGVRYAVLIGVIDLFLEMLPYVGPAIVFLVGSFLSLITSFRTFIYFAIAFSIIEFVQNSFITPHFVGERLKVTPVIIIIMIALGGAIFGALGVIIATPTFLIIRNLFEANSKVETLF